MKLFDTQIRKNAKYFPYFENYIGVLDNIYLPAYISVPLVSFY